jgi:phenylalanyl-tRNA synthetase beta chain
MYVSLEWLKQFTSIPKGIKPEELASTLTLKTAEVEEFSEGSELLDGVVVGQVKELHPHPNADKLRIAIVSVGPSQPNTKVVCGGDNLEEGMLIAYASPGCKVKWHGKGEPVVLEKVKIRGEESAGMICASEEIGLEKPKSEGPESILDLSAMKPKPGTPMTELLKLDDTVFEFDNKSLTHRPDLWGHYGIAREVSAIYKTPFKELNPKPPLPTKGDKLKVDIHSYDLCPRYCGVIIKNITVQESPEWIKKRLKAVGHQTYNNIVDVTNYISSELGQPLHAFDRNLIKKGIVVRTANKGEKIKTIDEKTYKLKEEMLVIADHENPIAIAGVMGGHKSGINPDTTEIIIESANFNGANVRRTATTLGLRTESVQRFEKQLDPELAHLAMLRAIELILEVNPGATVAGPITDNHSPKKKPRIIELDTDRTASKIGIQIDKAQIKEILTSLQFKVTESGKNLKVEVPSFRAQKDVSTEDDLIEEVARIYGYDKIEPVLPSLPTKLPEENPERTVKHDLRKFLSYGLNFNEIQSYSFYSKDDLENCSLDEETHVKIENYLSEDQTHMRTTLVPNLLKTIHSNTKNHPEFKLYEIGRTYKDIGEFFPLEEKWVCGAIHNTDKNKFYQAKGAAEAILRYLKIPFYKLIPSCEIPYAHPNESITIMAPTGETLGMIFTLHPQTAKNFSLQSNPTLFELNFSALINLAKKGRSFKDLPKFPGTLLDISVLVDKTIEIGTLKNAIEKADKSLIKSVELFDLYEGDNIAADKKSVAFKITLQAEDRTLKDEDMKRIQEQIFSNLQKLGGKIRGL